MKTLRTFFFTLLTLCSLVAVTVPAVPAYAEEVLDPVCLGIDPASPDAPTLCKENATEQSKTSNTIYGKDGIITKAISLLSIVIGIAAVVVIIIGGFKYILSAGDPNSINSAKNTILYAVIGLVISVVARAIIIFVLNEL